MKNRIIAIFYLTFFFNILFAGPGNNEGKIIQPNHSEIRINVVGDEWYHRIETLDGYSIVKNKDNWWVYVQKANNGNLVPSNIIVKSESSRLPNEISFINKIGKHLSPSDEIKSELIKQNPHTRIDKNKISKLSKISSNPITWKVLVILIEFPDLVHRETIESFDKMFNEPGWEGGIGSNGSFNDYFREVSYEKFGIDADIFGWFTASRSYRYYGWDQSDHWNRARQLTIDAVNAANAAGVDFTKYDNDGDGYVDQVIIVHSGHGAAQNGETQYIWPHRYWLSSPITVDGMKILDYTMQEELQYNRHSGIGMYAHEFGHALGLPDLYDYDGSSEGVGYWGLMGSSAWLDLGRTPSHYSPWCKEQLGWIFPKTINIQNQYNFNAVETNPNDIYKLNVKNNQNEYFLVENRQRNNFDSYLPGSGLLIWHIDNSVDNNDNENHKLVDVEEADGLRNLDNSTNRGDSGDPFPGTKINKSFDPFSNPNSKTYNNQETYISISNISGSGITMTADVSPSSSGLAKIKTDFSSGHAPLTVNFEDLTMSSSTITSWKWDFQNDGIIDATEQNPSFVFNDSGEYNVKLESSTGVYNYQTFSNIKVFDGNSSIFIKDPAHYVFINADSNLNLTDKFSIDVWIKPIYWGYDIDGHAFLFDKTYIKAFLQKTATSGFNEESLVFKIVNESGKIITWNTPAKSIILNKWQHLAVTYNSSNFELNIYIDSVKQNLIQNGSTSISGQIFDNLSKPLYLGNTRDRNKSFAGIIDELSIWNIERDKSDIISTINNKLNGDENGLICYWKMDEGSGTKIYDSGPNQFSGTNISEWEFGKEISDPVLGIDNISTIPNDYNIEQNYPNPFNPSTEIQFSLPVESKVVVKVFNILGEQLKVLANDKFSAGNHQLLFNASELASGVYIYLLDANGNDGTNYLKSRKMLLLK